MRRQRGLLLCRCRKRHGAARRGKRWLSSLFTSFTELASSSALHPHVAQSISVALYYVQRYKAHVASSSYVAVVCSAEKAKVRPLALLHTPPRLALLPVTHTGLALAAGAYSCASAPTSLRVPTLQHGTDKWALTQLIICGKR